MGKLKRNVCVVESDCLLFRATRGDCFMGSVCVSHARAGNGSFCKHGARSKTSGIQSAVPARVGRRGVSWRGCGACTAGIAYPRHAGAGERGSIGNREMEESLRPARDGCIVVIQKISPARVGNGQFREPGGAGATNERKQKAFAPPPACRAERGGRGAASGCAPKAGDAFRGGVE